MMKTKIKMMGALMTLIMALSAPVVYADTGNGGNLSGGQTAVSDQQSYPGQGDHAWKHGHWARHGCRLFHRLHLTDAQKTQLKDIWKKQRETMKSTVEQIKVNKKALNQELLAATPDMNKINAIQTQLKTLKTQMMDNRLNSTLEVKKILTAEQFGKYIELQKKMFARRCHKGDRRHGGWENR